MGIGKINKCEFRCYFQNIVQYWIENDLLYKCLSGNLEMTSLLQNNSVMTCGSWQCISADSGTVNPEKKDL
jgi:hypothetical protein